jgi:hypothetical protein
MSHSVMSLITGVFSSFFFALWIPSLTWVGDNLCGFGSQELPYQQVCNSQQAGD